MYIFVFRRNKFISRTLDVLLVSFFAISDLVGQNPNAWELLPSSPDAGEMGRHEDIFFTGPATGWVVNFRGELHRTSDAGETWELLNVAETAEGDPVRFRSTAWANEDLGWIGTLTDGHQLYQSTDGGQTLEDITSRLPAADSDGICGLWAVNENVVYGVGRFNGPARLFKTNDGGFTWSVKNMDEWAGRLIDVHFFDEMNGIVVGGTDEFGPRESRRCPSYCRWWRDVGGGVQDAQIQRVGMEDLLSNEKRRLRLHRETPNDRSRSSPEDNRRGAVLG